MQKISFIGCGNMSGAILKGILKSCLISPGEITVFDISLPVMDNLGKLGVNRAKDEISACDADIVIIGTKPHHVAGVMSKISKSLGGKALISVAAGITVQQFREMVEPGTRILRVMPNTPALVLEGTTVFCTETDFTEDELAKAKAYFEAAGLVEFLPEYMIDAVTGLSGGGPAYVALFIEAMADGGVLQGIPRATAYKLAAQTVLGAAKLILETEMHPGIAKDMVCSPGGTTIEGILALEKGGVRGAVMEAVRKASQKSATLKG